MLAFRHQRPPDLQRRLHEARPRRIVPPQFVSFTVRANRKSLESGLRRSVGLPRLSLELFSRNALQNRRREITNRQEAKKAKIEDRGSRIALRDYAIFDHQSSIFHLCVLGLLAVLDHCLCQTEPSAYSIRLIEIVSCF